MMLKIKFKNKLLAIDFILELLGLYYIYSHFQELTSLHNSICS